MRILVVSNYFWPENFRINDLAAGLVEKGHSVTVFTGIPNYPDGKFFKGYAIFKKRKEVYRGVNVVRFPLIPRGKGRGWELLVNYLSSAIFSCLWAPFAVRGRFDLIFVCQLSPVTIGLPGILLKRIKSIPLIFWILDLWPESLSATGAVRSRRVNNAVRKLVNFIYSRCDRVLMSSKGFVESIQAAGGYRGEVTYFPNWVEPEYMQRFDHTCLDQANIPQLPDGFKIMFAGNIGAAQDFETIIRAAEMLSLHKDKEIHWVVLGDGRRADWVRDQVEEKGLQNRFHLLGRYPAEQMPRFFHQADAMLVSLKDEPIFALTAPGKIQSYMAAGKPIIASIRGEGARVIEESQSGVVCPPERPGKMVDCVLELFQRTEEERETMGQRGFAYCQKHFNREKQFEFLEDLMEEVVQRNQR